MSKRKIQFLLFVMSIFAVIVVLSSCGNNTGTSITAESKINESTTPNNTSSKGTATTTSSTETMDDYVTITFKDYDGKILQNSRVKKGVIPTYSESNPIRSSDEEYSYTFRGWNPSLSEATVDTIYSATYNRKTASYRRVDNKIYFGKYPQTLITDNELIEKLDKIAGTKPTLLNSYNWEVYDYSICSISLNYMFYQDIDYDNDGEYDYRGVYFTQYRPISFSVISSISHTQQHKNGYYINNVYWFSYDAIEWKILTESDNKALIFADLIIDSQDYYPEEDGGASLFYHNGDIGLASNYALSNIRKFLNGNFYNDAFSDLQKELIKITNVDNSKESTLIVFNDLDRVYLSKDTITCSDTSDKIFLLSCGEVYTYYSSVNELITKGTDYAKCQGLSVYSNYNNNSISWLRSPYDSYRVYKIGCNHYEDSVLDLFETYGSTNITYAGVRPACWINL